MADDLTTILRFVGDPSNAEAAINGLVSSLQKAANAQNVFTASGAKNTQQAEKGEAAMLRQAQAIARIQQVSGDSAAAIKTLGDALAKASDPQSLPALRAQLQKTYLDTNYANSPLIGAIRKIKEESAALSQGLQQAGVSLTAALTVPLTALGIASVKSAKDIDQNVNVLRAFTGSAASAEKRLAELIATAQRTPGLTTSLATTLDAQLRVANVTEQTINRILPAIGRLNAVSSLADPRRFSQNLVQLVTQGFEKIDLKELVGQSPLAGEIIKQVFGVDNPTNAEAIRAAAQRLGITTTDQFFSAFAAAASSNSKLANVQESIAAQFEKLTDRVSVALRPLGLAIINAIQPVVTAIVPIIERIGQAFNNLPQGVQTAVLAVGAIAAAIGPLLIVLASAAQAVVAFAGAWAALSTALAAGGALAAIPALLNPIGLAVAGIVAVVGLATLAWASYEDATEKAAKITADTLTQQSANVQRTKEQAAEIAKLAEEQKTNALAHDNLAVSISKLDPVTQAYIKSLKDEQVAAAEVVRVTQEKATQSQDVLAAQFRTLSDAIQESVGRINSQSKTIANAQNSINAYVREAAKFKDIQQIAGHRTQEFSQTIVEANTEIEKEQEAILQLGAKLSGFADANNLTRESLTQQLQAMKLSQDQIDRLLIAYDAYRQKQEQNKQATDSATGSINQQSSAVAELINKLQQLNQVAGSEVDKRVKEIALTARNAAEAKAKLQQALKLDDDFFFAVEEKNRVARNIAALNTALDPTPKKTGGGGAASKRAATEGRQEAAAELKLLQIQEKEAELINKRINEALRVSLQDRLISLQTFTQLSIQNDQNLLQKRLAALKAEESAAVRTAKNSTDAEAKRAEFRLKAATLQQDFDIEIERKRDEQRRTEEKSAIDHENRLVEIRDAARKRAESQIKDAAGLNIIGQVAAEQQLIDIERERLDERRALLLRDLKLAGKNLEERQRINDELVQLEEERTGASEEASRRIRDASTRELNDRINFLRNLTGAYRDLESAQLDQVDAQAALAVQEGRLSPNNAALREFEQRRRAIQLETEDRQKSIAEQAAALQQQAVQAQQGSARILEIKRLETEALTAEQRRAQAIEQQIQNEQLAFLQSIGGGIRGLFSARVNELANNLGLAKGLIQNFVTELQATITPLDEIGAKAFQGFADGIGSAVSNFVLLGKTGPAVIRKVLAAQLAAIAQEATVNAIKELALGFGALFLNPPAAAGHFTSAALWASLAGASAVVGRAIAPKEAGGTASDRTQATDSSGNRVVEQGGALPTQAQNQITIRVVTHPDVTIERVQENVQNNGTLRTTFQQLAGATA